MIAHRVSRTLTTFVHSNVRTVIDNLERVLPSGTMKMTAAVRAQHGHDESHHETCAPDVVVFAKSTEDVATVVRICAEHRVPVIPFGTGTGLEGGVTATKGGVCIDLNGMDQIVELNVEDFDCTVQPGVTRKRVNAHLHDTGLWFPVDPGADASLCGMAATGASGTNAVRYGTMRSNVINMEVVLADGQILHTRGQDRRPKKSSAGYDLTSLFIGSEGTLGVITATTLRLHARPEHVAAAVCAFPTVHAAVVAVVQTLQCSIPMARIEFLDERQITACNGFSGLSLVEQPTLFLEFHGTESEVENQAKLVAEICAANDGGEFVWSRVTEERERLWKARHDAYWATMAMRPGTKGFTTDVCVPISRLADVITETRKDLDHSNIFGTIVGHVGDGNFHCILPVGSEEELHAVWAASNRLVERALAAKGTCTGEHGVGLGKRGYLLRERGQVGVAMMRALKTAIDPDNIMNPDKVLPSEL